MANPPPMTLQQGPMFIVCHKRVLRFETPSGSIQFLFAFRRMISEVKRKLQRLAGHLRQFNEIQERNTLIVFVAAAVPIGDPFVAPPTRNGREGGAVRVIEVRPRLKTNRGANMNPVKAAIGKASSRRAYGFTYGEVKIMC